MKGRIWSPEVNPSEVNDVLQKASVPEHSIPFMQAMSGGDPFLIGPYLFIAAEDWILAIGYPLEGDYTAGGFEDSLSSALHRTRARNCWAICPSLPDRLKPHQRQQDHYYILPLDGPIPGRLERLSEKAAVALRVEESNLFTPEHRRLWSEFMTRDLPPNILELYARTESVLPRAQGLSLLNAWDRKGHLAASLLLDSAPSRFVSYLLGAHSRSHYTPHASDLLFLEMIRLAKQRGKEYLHLGFGVNEGIRRFKVKWGGRPGLTYEMAEWQEKDGTGREKGTLVRMVTSMSSSPRKSIAWHPEQKRFAMVWELEKGGRTVLDRGYGPLLPLQFREFLSPAFQGGRHGPLRRPPGSGQYEPGGRDRAQPVLGQPTTHRCHDRRGDPAPRPGRLRPEGILGRISRS